MGQVIDVISDIVERAAKPSPACLDYSLRNLENHQVGFDGEHIAHNTLNKMGYKNPQVTRHRDPMDIITSKTAWEVKTLRYGGKAPARMFIKPNQKKAKLAWCKANGKNPKSMLIMINEVCEVFIRDGLGSFSPGSMKRVRFVKNWKEQIGHGRTERFYKPKAARHAKMKAAKIFDDSETQQMYKRNFEYYDANFTTKQLKHKISEDCHVILDYLDGWADDSLGNEALAMRLKAKVLETKSMYVVTARSRVSANILKRKVTALSEEEYLKARAITQAYYAKKKVSNVTLYRGVGGSTGKQLKKDIIAAKKRGKKFITIKEQSLSSYSPDREVANAFGTDVGGVVIKRKVPVKDVFIHDDVWSDVPFLGGAKYWDEHLVFGGSTKISLSDIYL